MALMKFGNPSVGINTLAWSHIANSEKPLSWLYSVTVSFTMNEDVDFSSLGHFFVVDKIQHHPGISATCCLY